MIIEYSNDYLAHHGILGQKWGVRRYQNPDGSLTAAGRERYGVGYERASIRYQQAKREYNASKHKPLKYQKLATAGLDYAKRDLQNEKIKNKLAKETKKSKHRQKLEAMYMKRGMTEEQAAIAAYKRARLEKILAVTAGVAITAGAVYAGKKYMDNNMDLFLKQGLQLQHIGEKDMMQDPDDYAFYAAFKEKDMLKYRGMYGGGKLRGKQKYSGGEGIYRNLFNVGEGGAKIANKKNARKALEQMIKNDKDFVLKLDLAFRKAKMDGFETNRARQALHNIARSGSGDSNELYNRFNQMLADHQHPEIQKVIDKYYGKLKTLGYAGIVDVNDKEYSGYNAKAPVIIFDRAKVALDKVSKLTESQLDSDRDAAYMNLGREAVAAATRGLVATSAATIGGYVGVAAAVKNGIQKTRQKMNAENDKIVDQYRKDHPNTELSYTEIIKMYEEEKRGKNAD